MYAIKKFVVYLKALLALVLIRSYENEKYKTLLIEAIIVVL